MPVSAQLLNALLLVYSVGFNYCTVDHRWTVLSQEKCIPQQGFFFFLSFVLLQNNSIQRDFMLPIGSCLRKDVGCNPMVVLGVCSKSGEHSNAQSVESVRFCFFLSLIHFENVEAYFVAVPNTMVGKCLLNILVINVSYYF